MNTKNTAIKLGKIDTSTLDIPPTPHEHAAAKALIKTGHNVTFIRPNRTKNTKTPDIKYRNLEWEIKCPKGSGRRVLDDTIRRALKQSKNIIVDLRHIGLHPKSCLNRLRTDRQLTRGIKRLIVIISGGTIDIK